MPFDRLNNPTLRHRCCWAGYSLDLMSFSDSNVARSLGEESGRGGSAIDTAAAIRVARFRTDLRAFLRTSERIARASGLTPQRHLLLLMIKGAPDGSERATVTELCERLQLAQSTVTELVRRTEDAGLIERERSKLDGRVAHVRLTTEGEHRLARAFTGLAEQRHQLMSLLARLSYEEPPDATR